jgi:hypothetical protein
VGHHHRPRHKTLDQKREEEVARNVAGSRPGTQGEHDNEPITPIHHQDVSFVISRSEWFCVHEGDLRWIDYLVPELGRRLYLL